MSLGVRRPARWVGSVDSSPFPSFIGGLGYFIFGYLIDVIFCGHVAVFQCLGGVSCYRTRLEACRSARIRLKGWAVGGWGLGLILGTRRLSLLGVGWNEWLMSR